MYWQVVIVGHFIGCILSPPSKVVSSKKMIYSHYYCSIRLLIWHVIFRMEYSFWSLTFRLTISWTCTNVMILVRYIIIWIICILSRISIPFLSRRFLGIFLKIICIRVIIANGKFDFFLVAWLKLWLSPRIFSILFSFLLTQFLSSVSECLTSSSTDSFWFSGNLISFSPIFTFIFFLVGFYFN